MATIQDTFTGTNGTALTAHTADTGETWTKHPNSGTGSMTIQSNALATGSTDSFYYNSATPLTAEYDVQVTVQGAGYVGGPCGRINTAANTYYICAYYAGGANRWSLDKVVAGVTTNLGTHDGDAPTSAKVVKLSITDATKKVFLDGVEIISSADNAITAAGKAGINGAGNGDTLDTFSATNMTSSSSSQTITPTQGTITLSGLAPSMNPFTNVRIREVLVNEAGSPVANQTGIHLLVWYNGFPNSAPDLSYSNMTTDPAGTTSWSLATGTLVYNQRIFYVAHDGHSSLSVYTCAQMTPTYS